MPEIHPFISNRWLEKINNEDILEKWFINKNESDQITSFAYVPDKNIKSIFLGSFPIWQIVTGPQNHQMVEFFYGSENNDFWSCMGGLLSLPFLNLDQRLSIIDTSKIGITDILKNVGRTPINSNLDKDLNAISYNNIVNLKTHFPNLKNIFVTSGGKRKVGKLNNKNKNVLTWLKASLVENNYLHSGFNQAGFVKSITINQENFNLIYLFSPSGNANVSLQGILNKNDNFGIDHLDISYFRKLQWGYYLKKYHFENDFNFKSLDQIWNTIAENNALLNFFEL